MKIRKIKKNLVKIAAAYPVATDVILPNKVKSLAISKALYKRNCFLSAENRLPVNVRDDHASFMLNVLYVNRMYSLNALSEFYSDYSKDILDNVRNLREDFLLDFLIRKTRLNELSYWDVVKVSSLVKNKQRASLSCLAYFCFSSEYNHTDFEVDEVIELHKFVKVKNLLDIPDLKPYSAHSNKYINVLLNLDVENFNDSLNRLKYSRGFLELISILSVIAPSSSWFLSPENIKFLIKSSCDIDNRDIILRILWNLCEFESFETICLIDELPHNALKLHEINKDYVKTNNVIASLIKNKDSSLRTLHIYGFWSVLSERPNKIFKYISSIKRLGYNVPAYNVYEHLFRGDVVKAERSRMQLDKGLMYFIENNIIKLQSKKIEFTSNKVLIIAESGVADEVRWARLYHKINFSNVWIVCDPRLKSLFEFNFPKINFIGHKRKFRGTGTSILDFHLSNIPYDLDSIKKDFDFVLSTGSLFTLLEDIETKQSSYLSLPEFRESSKASRKKIGIMWSSSLKASGRTLRYSLTKNDITYLIQRLPEVDFYSLQSPLIESDADFCREMNIFVEEDLDLYNDFYNSSIFMNSLDYVIGPSSLNTELAAACGAKFLHIANSPEVAMMRNGRVSDFGTHDQLSNNTLTIVPGIGYSGYSQQEINKSCIDKAIETISKS